MEQAKDWNELPLTLSVAQAAKVVGYGQARIRELCHAQDGIPCLRCGRAFRIPKDALREWLMKQATKWADSLQPTGSSWN